MEQLIQQLLELGLFTGKVLVVVFGIGVLLTLAASLAMKAKPGKDHLEVENVNAKIDGFRNQLKARILKKKDFQQLAKAEKKRKKKDQKAGGKGRKKLFVLNFDGDIRASAVQSLRDEITAVLSVAESSDEVLVCVTSPGGQAHAYGLAAAQLLRIKKHNLHLTVCVDKVAASGGYMMACTADKILASPFAIVGSIGVMAQIPNVHRLLKRNDIDVEEFTAGEFKRTVSLFGEISEKGRAKFNEQINETHMLFKNFVAQNRPQVNIDKVATGEYWPALQARELNLVDDIMTSDEYIFSQYQTADIYKLHMQERKKLSEKLSEMFAQGLAQVVEKVSEWSRFMARL